MASGEGILSTGPPRSDIHRVQSGTKTDTNPEKVSGERVIFGGEHEMSGQHEMKAVIKG